MKQIKFIRRRIAALVLSVGYNSGKWLFACIEYRISYDQPSLLLGKLYRQWILLLLQNNNRTAFDVSLLDAGALQLRPSRSRLHHDQRQ